MLLEHGRRYCNRSGAIVRVRRDIIVHPTHFPFRDAEGHIYDETGRNALSRARDLISLYEENMLIKLGFWYLNAMGERRHIKAVDGPYYEDQDGRKYNAHGLCLKPGRMHQNLVSEAPEADVAPDLTPVAMDPPTEATVPVPEPVPYFYYAVGQRYLMSDGTERVVHAVNTSGEAALKRQDCAKVHWFYPSGNPAMSDAQCSVGRLLPTGDVAVPRGSLVPNAWNAWAETATVSGCTDAARMPEVVTEARKVLFRTDESDPTGRGAHAPGAKLDAGKPWAYTVIRAFWPALRQCFDLSTHQAQVIDRLFSVGTAAAFAEVAGFTQGVPALVNWTLPDALTGAVSVGTHGAQKYAKDSWLEVPDGINRYTEAAGRHALKILLGEEIDPDFGCRHFDHLAWCLFAIETLRVREAAVVEFKAPVDTQVTP